MPATFQTHHRRLRKVLDYIDAHYAESLTAEELSERAAFSKFHFHRQFRACTGISVQRYIQLLRLKRACHLLAFRHISITRIAGEVGYVAPEAFSRVFKQLSGQTPSEFRQAPDWKVWRSLFVALQSVRHSMLHTSLRFEQVSIVDFPATPIVFMTHLGDPDRLSDTLRAFIRWRKQQGVGPRVSRTFNILYNDPEMAGNDYRIDLCVATGRLPVAIDGSLQAGLIPQGRCAVLRQQGIADDLRAALDFLYGHWLPASGEQLRDFPVFVERVRFFPDVAEHEAVTDIFLPLR